MTDFRLFHLPPSRQPRRLAIPFWTRFLNIRRALGQCRRPATKHDRLIFHLNYTVGSIFMEKPANVSFGFVTLRRISKRNVRARKEQAKKAFFIEQLPVRPCL